LEDNEYRAENGDEHEGREHRGTTLFEPPFWRGHGLMMRLPLLIRNVKSGDFVDNNAILRCGIRAWLV
jgi:hypothetical protein